ncbi:hypothetical protein [Streptomyces sp. SID5643]|uniref:hypothetical protein n=1 Tax=Streptomyces sp. SID5643 TaxID=2690307 RepID=UPI00136DFBF4|nr:hypothetical protein [Streptomyces sp. SID5643]MZF83442.1 hypothetical protein [Streptomyces sp. SID5643]
MRQRTGADPAVRGVSLVIPGTGTPIVGPSGADKTPLFASPWARALLCTPDVLLLDEAPARLPTG